MSVLLFSVNSLKDGHLWDRHQVRECRSKRESDKGSTERKGPIEGVRLIEVFVKRESTVPFIMVEFFKKNEFERGFSSAWWSKLSHDWLRGSRDKVIERYLPIDMSIVVISQARINSFNEGLNLCIN